MPSKTLIRSKEFPYHVTARSNNKERFQADPAEVWEIFCSEIKLIVEKYHCRIHAFVLMPNHFHLLITTPEDDLGIVMQHFMAAVTIKMNRLSGRTGRIFGGRYHWSLIDHEQYYDCALKYIYRNPVKARLCDRVESYPFSSINAALSGINNPFELHPPAGHVHNIPDQDSKKFLEWLNRPFLNEQEDAIKQAFRRTRFKPPKTGWKRSSVILEGFTSMNMTRIAS